jgi:guanine nucleotide exchange factor
MKFENIGFSNTVDGIAYLSCADCDLGPLGYHDRAKLPQLYHIAIDRVKVL